MLSLNERYAKRCLHREKKAVRRMNRGRQGDLPPVPNKDDLEFPLEEGKFPKDFFRFSVWAEAMNKETGRVEKRRHLIFATSEQLRHLGNVRGWFMDGTFKVIAKPFMQLYSIHGFLKGVILFIIFHW